MSPPWNGRGLYYDALLQGDRQASRPDDVFTRFLTQEQRSRAPARPQPEPPASEGSARWEADENPNVTDNLSVPTETEIAELCELTLEAGISLENLAKKASVVQINGNLLDTTEVAVPRLKAIKWYSMQFSKFGYRDEWLADAILYMDRLAVGLHATNAIPILQGRPKQAAMWTMSHESIWLASMFIALKMSEAEAELDLALLDLLLPLVPLKEGETKVSKQRFSQIKKYEIWAARLLDYRLTVPTPLQLVQHMVREICRTAGPCEGGWPGLKVMKLPLLLGPPLKNKTEEDLKKKALPPRSVNMFHVAASLLVDLAIVHQPGKAYGNQLPAGALALAVVQLALSAFGEPPRKFKAKVPELQEELKLPESVTAEILKGLMACLYRLWTNAAESSPVVQKWRQRLKKDDPTAILPMAPPKATLPLDLQEWLDFNTPQRKHQERQELSATPTCREMQPNRDEEVGKGAPTMHARTLRIGRQEGQELSATPTCREMQPNRDEEVGKGAPTMHARTLRIGRQERQELSATPTCRVMQPNRDEEVGKGAPTMHARTLRIGRHVECPAGAQSEVSVVQRGLSQGSVPDKAKRYDEESSEQQTPAAKRAKKKADDDDASYNPEDDESGEGSDCGTDGIVKNRKKVRPRQGARVLKSASRIGASRQAKAKASKAKRQSKPPRKAMIVAQHLPFGHALAKRDARHLS